MKRMPSSLNNKGFTLIEVMVVIVIISIIASLIVLNIDGVDQRKAMQAREMLLLDLRQINREANDQSRIYALDFHPATDVATAQYGLVEYIPRQQGTEQGIRVIDSKPWKEVTDFNRRTLPDQVSFLVEPQDHRFQDANNPDLLGNNAPQLIWFGNGETKPVTIQMYYQQKPVGGVIRVDYLGKVDEEK
ncbi:MULTISPECIES: prepilin-type N-terminal cleavage/methylation domain-containing protein [unclassified Acinetobacter]|jgi:general secretion pathway protein G|uniref:prepilin-type N-terminal cleavage/methylation domain-containing protein n=1 Tax=Acinetobacter TaxID=469 RepID=UPI0018AA7538|nr:MULTISPECIES: prepilin-type N-terminal cleavage/methylation domain-containing protein [unclassified Acinetobacter]MBJ9951600.1 prepilin-type N-terminal cleavage/methylation domain-containing protein [Acinetobacter baumannii]